MRKYQVIVGAVLALAFAVHAALMAIVAGRVPAGALQLVLAIAAAGVAAAWGGVGGVSRMPVRDLVTSSLAGVLGLFLAPALVLANRYSDAPAGTELLFFSAVGWGAIAVVAGAVTMWRRGRGRHAGALAAAAVAALAGAAGLLASWERPSSFNPLIKTPVEQLAGLAGGVAFAAFAIMLAGPLARVGRKCLTVAGLAGLALSLAWLPFAPGGVGGLNRLAEVPGVIGLWAAAWAAVAVLWPAFVAEAGLARGGAAMLLAPLLVAALSVVERAVGVTGPNPIDWPGVAGGGLVVAAAVTRIVTADPDRVVSPRTWSRLLSSAVAIAAVIALALPTLTAAVEASSGGPAFRASWSLAGWETAPAWMVAAMAALLAGALLDENLAAVATALAALPSAALLSSTPLHTLTRWLSPDIQQDYGTEYARIDFAAVPNWPMRVAWAGAAVGLVVLLTCRIARTQRSADRPTTSEETS